MLVAIPDVLNSTEVAVLRAALDAAEWADGGVTAGHQSVRAKNNAQLPENSALGKFGNLLL